MPAIAHRRILLQKALVLADLIREKIRLIPLCMQIKIETNAKRIVEDCNVKF